MILNERDYKMSSVDKDIKSEISKLSDAIHEKQIKSQQKKFDSTQMMIQKKSQDESKLRGCLSRIRKIQDCFSLKLKLRNDKVIHINLEYHLNLDYEAGDGYWDLEMEYKPYPGATVWNLEKTRDFSKILQFFNYEEIACAIIEALNEKLNS